MVGGHAQDHPHLARRNRITSLADFVASRYGKSALLGGLVTVIAVVGILPYISLQLKAVSSSFTILVQYPEIVDAGAARRGAGRCRTPRSGWRCSWPPSRSLFGTRHLDATERHEGMVAAIAFESLVKLLAFLAVGVFVTFGIYDGFGDIFARAARARASSRALMTPLDGVAGSYASWAWLTILSMLAIMFLPRQFQVAVVENVDEKHLAKAIWLFPLYMLAINVFVLPIAFGGLLHFPARQRRRRHLRADAADGRAAGGARAAGVHRRPVGGDRHGDRRDHRAVDHGLQRPGDAGAAAPARRCGSHERRDLTGLLLGIRRGAIVRSCCSATSTSGSPARPTRWSRSA